MTTITSKFNSSVIKLTPFTIQHAIIVLITTTFLSPHQNLNPSHPKLTVTHTTLSSNSSPTTTPLTNQPNIFAPCFSTQVTRFTHTSHLPTTTLSNITTSTAPTNYYLNLPPRLSVSHPNPTFAFTASIIATPLPTLLSLNLQLHRPLKHTLRFITNHQVSSSPNTWVLVVSGVRPWSHARAGSTSRGV